MSDRHNNAIGPNVREAKQRPSKFVPVLSAVALAGALSVATQYFAHTFKYHPSLGSNFDHLYAPWRILVWAGKWYSAYPDAFVRAGSIGVGAGSLALLGLLITRMIGTNTAKANVYMHGSARWANLKDIQAAGLIAKSGTFLQRMQGTEPGGGEGVYVGAWIDSSGVQHYLRDNGPSHVLTYAPTRSGKGVGLVLPTLLSWRHSAVITDLKGELWALTSGWRQRYAKNKVLRFEPAALNGSVRWNPLEEIRRGTQYEIGDVQNLATLIVDPDGKGLVSHWDKTSQALLVGLIIHAIYKAKPGDTPASLVDVDKMLVDPNMNVAELWMEMTTYKHVNGINHPVVGASARDMMDRPPDEAGSVLSTTKSFLSLYRDPVVARNVSSSEFRIRDLMHNDCPVSLYIITQPDDKSRLRPLVRILMNMIVRLLTGKMEFENGRPKVNYKHRLLGMLDEFPSMGKLEILQESLAFVAGYGIKMYLICQDINQLKSKETGYGPDETITSNCHIQNAYPPNRVETAEHLSKLTGQTTVINEQITTSGKRTSMLLGQVSRTTQQVQRALLTVDECLRMPGPIKNETGEIASAGDMVVYAAGFPAIYGKQPLYFQDPIFKARAEVPEPAQSDRLRQSALVTEREAENVTVTI